VQFALSPITFLYAAVLRVLREMPSVFATLYQSDVSAPMSFYFILSRKEKLVPFIDYEIEYIAGWGLKEGIDIKINRTKLIYLYNYYYIIINMYNIKYYNNI
jgi:hypothetical protein